MRLFNRKLNKHTSDNKGMTLVEMIVSFMLLSIFVVMSTIIISNVVALYYRVRGESYARQVGDIVMKKITAEISGAEYYGDSALDPVIYKRSADGGDSSYDLALVDETDTRIRMYAKDGILRIYYYPINDDNQPSNTRSAVEWTFDKKMYNGYKLVSLDFAQANSALNEELAEKYDISGVDKTAYPSNVVAVYMKLKSGKYGTFSICRYVKMYNAPELEYNIEIVDVSE